MQVNLRWLADFVDMGAARDNGGSGAGNVHAVQAQEIARLLTAAGVEVEGISDPAAHAHGVVVAEVRDVQPHPSADKLRLCTVFDGELDRPVVCGAANVATGQRVAFARPGAKLGKIVIEKRALRGVDSHGMICARSELGLGEGGADEGIWILPADAPLGREVFEVMGIAPVLSLSVTPNRPDLLSHLGVAREIAAATQKKLRPASWRLIEQGPPVTSHARVVIDDPAGCKRYVARVVRNVKVGPSPSWLRERLESIGQRSINNVVDITNLVLMELGQPLHAFDLGRLASEANLPTIHVRAARPGEELVTLDGVTRKLEPTDLVIADAERAVAVAGIMGGADSEVSQGTTAILIESAWFDPNRVRRTARRLGLNTEASQRFERGADPGIAGKAADRCAQLIDELCGGEVCKGAIDASQKPELGRDLTLRIDRVRRILGIALDAEDIVRLLEPLDILCTSRNEASLRFQTPSFRPDLEREIDLIEEIARRFGFDRIPERLPDASGLFVAQPEPAPRFVSQARDALLGAGLAEVVTYGFGSPSHHPNAVRLVNPLGEELSAMRTSLWPGLLQVLSHNQRHGQGDVRLFEIGSTFSPRPRDDEADERDRDLPREQLQAAVLIAGGRAAGRWFERGERADFSDLKGCVETLLDSFDRQVTVRWHPDAREPRTNPHACAVLWADGAGEAVRLGVVAALHPQFVEQLGATGPVCAAEIDLSALAALPARRVQHAPLPRFPSMRRDVAVVAPRTVSSAQIEALLRARAGGALGPDVIEGVRVFDVYAGKPIPEGMVSLAYAIAYRHPSRTLTEGEVQTAFEGVLAALRQDLGLEVRSA